VTISDRLSPTERPIRPAAPDSGRRRMWRWVALGAAWLAVAAGVVVGIRPRGLDLRDTYGVGSPVWRPDGWIYFTANGSGDSEATNYLWRVRPGEAARPVDTGDFHCPDVWELVDVFAVGERDLGLGVACHHHSDVAYYHMDLADHSVMRLSEPVDGAVSATWNATGSEGFVATWTATGFGPRQGERCDIGLTRVTARGVTCDLSTSVRAPVYAARGDRVFFLGAPCAPSTYTIARQWSVCVWSLGSTQPRAVGGSFADPHAVAVDPAMTRTIVTDDAGQWLVDLRDGTTRRIGDGSRRDATFSPDGRYVAVSSSRSPLLFGGGARLHILATADL
jgi:hypothetical protein